MTIQDVIDTHFAGNASAFARAIGTSQQRVFYWQHKAKNVPAEMCPRIAEATENRVTVHDLRPDVFGVAA